MHYRSDDQLDCYDKPFAVTDHPLDALLKAHGIAAVVPQTPANPSFSVIVRTQGNRPKSLREAVTSIHGQTYQQYELIVVVHGSLATFETVSAEFAASAGISEDGNAGSQSADSQNTQNTSTVEDDSETPADKTPSKTRVLHVQGGGRARPLNVGLDAATGDYVCFLDDDDLAKPQWLSVFAKTASSAPGTIIRAVVESQNWTTEGSGQPVRAVGDVEKPFASSFDLLAHMSMNDTPICAIAVPRLATERFNVRFDETLPVFEDWEFLMRLAMLVGVTSTPEITALYRRLDSGNADTDHDQQTWEETHAEVIKRLSSRPVLLPVGDAQRVASSHYVVGGESRHSQELRNAREELAILTRSPRRWFKAFSTKAVKALIQRIRNRS